MKRIPLPIRYKLLNTIQRISTQTIGFDISAVHTITYLKYFEVSHRERSEQLIQGFNIILFNQQIVIASCIGFLLVIGLKFTEIQKNISHE